MCSAQLLCVCWSVCCMLACGEGGAGRGEQRQRGQPVHDGGPQDEALPGLDQVELCEEEEAQLHHDEEQPGGQCDPQVVGGEHRVVREAEQQLAGGGRSVSCLDVQSQRDVTCNNGVRPQKVCTLEHLIRADLGQSTFSPGTLIEIEEG